jgi:hypothetical protein
MCRAEEDEDAAASGSEVASHPLLYLVVADDLALWEVLIGRWDLTRVITPQIATPHKRTGRQKQGNRKDITE